MNTTESLVTMFLARADDFGCVGLSAKQVNWLRDVWARQYPNAPTSNHRPIRVKDENGKYYDFVIYPQGGGFLRPA